MGGPGFCFEPGHFLVEILRGISPQYVNNSFKSAENLPFHIILIHPLFPREVARVWIWYIMQLTEKQKWYKIYYSPTSFAILESSNKTGIYVVTGGQVYVYLAFIQSRKARIKFMFICLSVCPHITARLSLDGIPWNSILGTFMKICREIRNFFKIGKKCQILYMTA
jgi:hypothetical protein